jgi:hypothetical protein
MKVTFYERSIFTKSQGKYELFYKELSTSSFCDPENRTIPSLITKRFEPIEVPDGTTDEEALQFFMMYKSALKREQADKMERELAELRHDLECDES